MGKSSKNKKRAQEKQSAKLLKAAAAGDVSGAEKALALGAKLDLAMKDGDTPLIIAAENGHASALRRFLEK